jgi:uncharacterized protein YqjF (DUF2071 family)
MGATLELERQPHRSPTIVRQRWDAISFLHWPMDRTAVQRQVPTGLEVETFDGRAWVGLVPFRNTVTPPLVPLPRWTFLEVNVRTYVRASDGTRGIFFFAFDVPHLWMVAGARLVLGARYDWAATSVRERPGAIRYRSRRAGHRARMDVVVHPRERIATQAETSLERFLTDRFALYSASPIGLVRVDVGHRPWVLRRAEAEIRCQELVAACGLPEPDAPPLVHAADPIPDARVLLPERVRP